MTTAEDRADLYRLLAVGFSNPTAELSRGLQNGTYLHDVAACATALGPVGWYSEPLALLEHHAGRWAGMQEDELLRELRVEYARLFIVTGPEAVSPYESIHCDPPDSHGAVLLMIGPSARAVERAYREAGVALSADYREPPDHVALELEFLAHLCAREAMAGQENDRERSAHWCRLQRKLLKEHLGNWGPGFCRAVTDSTKHPFYQALAAHTAAFLRLEQAA